jgi:outer membrane protein assembly factor BamB
MKRRNLIALLLFFLISYNLYSQSGNQAISGDWNNGGGNPSKNGLSSMPGTAGDSVRWSASNDGFIGFPVYIEGNKLVTMKFNAMTNAPIVCYDLYTGQLLWTKDVTGLAGRSLPLGIRNGKVYAMRLTESLRDTLFALNANTGETIWRANVTTDTYVTASASFASNGDLLVEGYFRMYRINHLNGQLIWETNIVPLVMGASEISVYENTGYFWENIGNNSYVTAIDISSGQRKYSRIITDTHPGGAINQCALMVGSNGVIYAHKQEDNVTALQDNGNALNILWEREITGNSPFSLMCTGPDGSVYAPDNGKIIRINPGTGQITATSPVISSNPNLFQLRLSAASNGAIYATNGESSVYAFTSDLNQLWSDNVPNLNTSGVAIGNNGLIAVAGAGVVKVYGSSTTGIFTASVLNLPENLILKQNFPNPFNPVTNIEFELRQSGLTRITIHDINGRVVERLLESDMAGGIYRVSWHPQGISSGQYFYTLEQGSSKITKKLTILK